MAQKILNPSMVWVSHPECFEESFERSYDKHRKKMRILKLLDEANRRGIPIALSARKSSREYGMTKKIVDGIRKLEKQMGFFDKKILKPEKKIIKLVRRSVYATQNIQAGSKINLENVKFLRKTTTDDYLYLQDIIGKKTKKKIFRNQRIDLKKLI